MVFFCSHERVNNSVLDLHLIRSCATKMGKATRSKIRFLRRGRIAASFPLLSVILSEIRQVPNGVRSNQPQAHTAGGEAYPRASINMTATTLWLTSPISRRFWRTDAPDNIASQADGDFWLSHFSKWNNFISGVGKKSPDALLHSQFMQISRESRNERAIYFFLRVNLTPNRAMLFLHAAKVAFRRMT